VLQKLEAQIRNQGADLKILGVGTTGYAKDILKDVVARTRRWWKPWRTRRAGLHFYDDVDVISNVGGQDIKIIILKNGRREGFQAEHAVFGGHGYFLQSTAQGFNVPVEDYADTVSGQGNSRRSAMAARCSCRVTSWTSSARVEARRDHGGAVQRAAKEHLAVRVANSEPLGHWTALPATGRHAVQPGGGEGAGRFYRVALQGQGHSADVIVHSALRRGGRIGAALKRGGCSTTGG